MERAGLWPVQGIWKEGRGRMAGLQPLFHALLRAMGAVAAAAAPPGRHRFTSRAAGNRLTRGQAAAEANVSGA